MTYLECRLTLYHFLERLLPQTGGLEAALHGHRDRRPAQAVMGTLAHDDTIRGDAAERVHHDLEQDVAPDTTSLERVGILGLGTVQELGRVVHEPPRRDRVEGLQDRYLTGDRPGGGEAEQNRRRPHSHHLMTTERQRPYGASPGGEGTTSFPNKPGPPSQ